MKRQRGIIATTHVVPDGNRLAPSALEGIARQIQEVFIPVNVEHDPRLPVIGRIVGAEIKELGDGELGLEAVIELFEPDDQLPPLDETRPVVMRSYELNRLQVIFDRGLRGPEDQADILELSNALGTTAEEDHKWALEPLTILTIGAAFALSHFAKEFLAAAGKDTYEFVKAKIKRIMRRRRPDETERLLKLEFELYEGERRIWVDVLLTNPTDNEIDTILVEGLNEIQKLTAAVLATNEPVRRLVLSYSQESLQILYGVRFDGVPLSLGIRDVGQEDA
jgi:hypothetical protein